jgi:hypothetical protein
LFGKKIEQVRKNFPAIYQHLLETVKPLRDKDNRQSYRENWWIFAEPRPEFREAVEDMDRYIAIPQTVKHIVFQCWIKLPCQTKPWCLSRWLMDTILE